MFAYSFPPWCLNTSEFYEKKNYGIAKLNLLKMCRFTIVYHLKHNDGKKKYCWTRSSYCVSWHNQITGRPYLRHTLNFFKDFQYIQISDRRTVLLMLGCTVYSNQCNDCIITYCGLQRADADCGGRGGGPNVTPDGAPSLSSVRPQGGSVLSVTEQEGRGQYYRPGFIGQNPYLSEGLLS